MLYFPHMRFHYDIVRHFGRIRAELRDFVLALRYEIRFMEIYLACRRIAGWSLPIHGCSDVDLSSKEYSSN